MTMFGMPPDDPEGLMPGVDGTIGFGDQGDSLTDSHDPNAEMVHETDESMASEAVRDPAPPTEDDSLATGGLQEDPLANSHRDEHHDHTGM